MLVNRLATIFIFLMISLASGCTKPGGNTLKTSDIVSLNDHAQQQPTKLGVGDQLSIKCYHNSKLNDEVTIHPDGTISLQLIGDILAAGKTPTELAATINSKYSKIFAISANAYSLGVGDQLSVKFYFNSELNEDLLVRPDGKISLQLVGDVPAAGLTPTQIQENLKALYSKFLDSTDIAVIVRDFKTPEISLSVKDFASRRVYVGGEVAKPGSIPITAMLRSYDAVSQAGGALATANLDSVVIIRYNGTQKPDAYAINLNMVMKGELPDIQLMPYDIIYLPKTIIAQLDLFVDQYLNKIIPRSVSFPFIYHINSGIQ